MPEEYEERRSLYGDGWRQGSIFHLDLQVHKHVIGNDREPLEEAVSCQTWVVASQDCDLAAAREEDNDAIVEVRPVVEDDDADWGIRSRKLRLDERRCVLADGIPASVSPALLSYAARATREPPLSEARASAFKTWLGLRFDRPAVPEHLVPLALDISKRLRRPSGRHVAGTVHDVLIQFGESVPPRAALFAVIEDGADRETVRRWLADVARAVPSDVGVVVQVDVGTKAETSLELIETSYAADASQITWRGPDPTGAT
jgi:hypothetical protein